MKFLRRVTNNLFNFALTPTCVYTRCFPSVCGINITGDSGGIWTHDLLLTSADVLTSRPPSLPDDDRPARILYSSGFRDIYTCTCTCRLMKFLRRVSCQWLNSHECLLVAQLTMYMYVHAWSIPCPLFPPLIPLPLLHAILSQVSLPLLIIPILVPDFLPLIFCPSINPSFHVVRNLCVSLPVSKNHFLLEMEVVVLNCSDHHSMYYVSVVLYCFQCNFVTMLVTVLKLLFWIFLEPDTLNQETSDTTGYPKSGNFRYCNRIPV